MRHKTLTVSEEAYQALARLKKERESFTQVILRLTDKKERGTLLDFVRSLEPDEGFAQELEKVVEERKTIVAEAPRFS
jgi:predicted CopG family antitoxin